MGRGECTKGNRIVVTVGLLTIGAFLLSCYRDGQGDRPDEIPEEDLHSLQRQAMVAKDLRARDIDDESVLRAMSLVQRHLFVPQELRDQAYADHPLPIGEDQTISQPYIVAYMTQALRLEPGDRVLEIGTGSGYQAAILAQIATEVYTIEIIPSLTARAAATLTGAGYQNVHLRTGDGYFGWPQQAPFDAIIVTAAPDHIPPALVEQLGAGAHLVLPVGDHNQELIRVTRAGSETKTERLLPVRFVPMTGRARGD